MARLKTNIQKPVSLISNVLLYSLLLVYPLSELLIITFPEDLINLRHLVNVYLFTAIILYWTINKKDPDFIWFLVAFLILCLSKFFICHYYLNESIISSLMKNTHMIKFSAILFLLSSGGIITIKRYLEYFINKVFMRIIYINSILIIAGFVFSISAFRTYGSPERFGYNGIFQHTAPITYFYLFAIIFSYKFYLKTKSYWYLIYILSACILIGKKSIFLFCVSLLIYHLIQRVRESRVLIILLISISTAGLVFVKDSIWITIIKNDGLISAVFSYRDNLLEAWITNIQRDWYAWNYFIGGVNFWQFRTELGVFDIFLSVGVLGCAIILLALIKKFLHLSFMGRFFFLSLFVINFLAGGLLINLASTIIFILFLNNESKKSISNCNSPSR